MYKKLLWTENDLKSWSMLSYLTLEEYSSTLMITAHATTKQRFSTIFQSFTSSIWLLCFLSLSAVTLAIIFTYNFYKLPGKSHLLFSEIMNPWDMAFKIWFSFANSCDIQKWFQINSTGATHI